MWKKSLFLFKNKIKNDKINRDKNFKKYVLNQLKLFLYLKIKQ